MTRATAALLLAFVAFGGAILTFVVSSGGSTTRVVRTQTTVVESPPLTPLPRDSGPKNNPKRTGFSSGTRLINPGKTPNSSVRPQNRSLPSRKRQAPKTTPTPRPSSSQAPQPSPAPSPQPSPPPPVVGVTAPAPVAVCARPVATVNC